MENLSTSQNIQYNITEIKNNDETKINHHLKLKTDNQVINKKEVSFFPPDLFEPKRNNKYKSPPHILKQQSQNKLYISQLKQQPKPQQKNVVFMKFR